jgi:hypothetical protein
MSGVTQISAVIARTTSERLERYTSGHGLKKGAVIEAALLHHLQALDELPQDVIIPAKVVVGCGAFGRIADRVRKPRRPTRAMKALMSGDRPIPTTLFLSLGSIPED